MKLKQVGSVWVLLAAVGVGLTGCSAESNLPTGASSLHSSSGDDMFHAPVAPLALEETDCPNLQEFRFRMSDPGSIDGNVVKAWIKLVGAPADATSLRIWWDYPDGDSVDHRLEDLLVTQNEDGTINVEFMAVHTYNDITEETERKVRAELIVGNEGTHCARVRHITVTVPEEEPVAKKKKEGGPCVSTFGSEFVVLCHES